MHEHSALFAASKTNDCAPPGMKIDNTTQLPLKIGDRNQDRTLNCTTKYRLQRANIFSTETNRQYNALAAPALCAALKLQVATALHGQIRWATNVTGAKKTHSLCMKTEQNSIPNQSVNHRTKYITL